MRAATLSSHELSLGLLLLAGCDPSGVSYVGPVTDQTNIEDTSAQGNTDLKACDEREFSGRCTLYSGPGWNASDVQSGCYASVLASCPPTDIGGCRFSQGEASEYILWYYEGLYYSLADASFLEADCLNGFGAWSP